MPPQSDVFFVNTKLTELWVLMMPNYCQAVGVGKEGNRGCITDTMLSLTLDNEERIHKQLSS